MTFQPGNQLSAGVNRPKFVRDSFLQSIKALGADETGNWRKLRRVTDAIVKLAENGDMAAARELFDRLDGKVPQALVANEDGGPIVLQVVRYVVEPDKPQVIDITPQSTIDIEAETVSGDIEAPNTAAKTTT